MSTLNLLRNGDGGRGDVMERLRLPNAASMTGDGVFGEKHGHDGWVANELELPSRRKAEASTLSSYSKLSASPVDEGILRLGLPPLPDNPLPALSMTSRSRTVPTGDFDAVIAGKTRDAPVGDDGLEWYTERPEQVGFRDDAVRDGDDVVHDSGDIADVRDDDDERYVASFKLDQAEKSDSAADTVSNIDDEDEELVPRGGVVERKHAKPDDGQDGSPRHEKARSLPRLLFKPTHALIAILVLTVALCASLTMLVQQTMNFAKEESATTSVVSGADDSRGSSHSGNKSKSRKSKSKAGASSASAANPNVAQAPQQSGVGGTANSSLVDINTADATRLQTIKGVGPVMAQRIIDYRTANGPFTSVDQLQQVSGVGPKTLEKMRGQVTV
ncbi:helix-hairpin-helix domain-containing protein [Bifidobacterium sp. ESL0790]|uniref:ComEA family DNA-binding protein n=1 Tax=Bifidobacterium sp. ESL0790 TaxID=2983233 RepID=UPI0023F999BC|nr:helix-hairpin-helix domain-containing protein [Bifidobacterium sp. ESL0790]WEV71769.1 helix-hairpin-helix domain-containing protein [Bifidobacterium sp. ESL0790]